MVYWQLEGSAHQYQSATMNHLYEATSATLLSRLHDPADHVAWDAFVKRYEPSVRSYCKRKFLSDSLTDEVVSEVLMTLGRHMPSFEYDEGRSFRTWLKTVIHSKLTDVIRREARRQEQAQGGTIMHMQLAEVSDRHKLDGVADELSEELTSVIDRRPVGPPATDRADQGAGSQVMGGLRTPQTKRPGRGNRSETTRHDGCCCPCSREPHA